MNYVIVAGLIITLVLFIEGRLKPRIDVTREGDVLLWYNTHAKKFITRQHVKLFKLKS